MPRTALVTGGSRGIGKAIVQELEKAGVGVLAPEREVLDLEKPASIRSWLNSMEEDVIDIVVNNAGINYLGKLGALHSDSLSDMLQINLQGPFQLLQGLMPGMKDRKWGRVVNVSSIWSLVAREGRGGYAAAKAALNGLTRVAAVEGAWHGVVVNAVAPGFIDTEMTRRNMSPSDIEAMEDTIPMMRLGTPEEIARLVRWLCSEENTYMTGQVLVIDGGYSIV